MAKNLSEKEVNEKGKKRAKAKKDFYWHLGAWVLFGILLLIIWSTVGDRHTVLFAPMGIWGVFVLLHGLNVFVFGKKPDTEAVEKEAEKIKREQG